MKNPILLVGSNSSIGKEIQKLDFDFINTTSKNLNLSDVNSIEQFVKDLPVKIRGAVLCAGIVKTIPLGATSSSHLNQHMYQVFNVNCFGPMLLINSLLKHKKIEPCASFIFISSIGKDMHMPGNSIYSSSKKALQRFVDFLVVEVSRKNRIRFNSISPGQLTEGIGKDLLTNPNEENRYPLGYGHPADIIGAVRFLLSDESKWVNGADIVIDGGRVLN